MKSLLLSILLGTSLLFAGESLPVTTINNSSSVNVIVIVLTTTNQLPAVIYTITNSIPGVKIYIPNSKISLLEAEIKLLEIRFKDNYDGYPNTFVAISTPESQVSLDKLILVWEQQNKDLKIITDKRKELQKLYEYTHK